MTHSETTLDYLEDLGISLSIPVLSEGRTFDIEIRPCFTGPFCLPDDYEQASPAYLIHHGKLCFQKPITIMMRHHANLVSEEDCEDMAFFSASSTPQYSVESYPVYKFKKINTPDCIFKPGELVGQISLKHFCIVTSGKRKRAEEAPDESSDSSASTKKHQGMVM